MNRRTGRARPKRSPNGFRGARADGRSRCSTAARRSAPRSRRSSCSRSTRRPAAGGRRSSSPACSAFCGFRCSAGCIDRPKSIRGSPRRSGRTSSRIARRHRRPGSGAARPLSYRTLLTLPQTWGIVIGKALTDPVWFFITDWFAIYLVSRGFPLEDSLLAFWVPFLAADLGNFAGGGVSSVADQARLERWAPRARRSIVLGALGMLLLIPGDLHRRRCSRLPPASPSPRSLMRRCRR